VDSPSFSKENPPSFNKSVDAFQSVYIAPQISTKLSPSHAKFPAASLVSKTLQKQAGFVLSFSAILVGISRTLKTAPKKNACSSLAGAPG
jgi:hypothetical protein